MRDPVCWVWLCSVVIPCATQDDANRDNVCTPIISSGISRPPHPDHLAYTLSFGTTKHCSYFDLRFRNLQQFSGKIYCISSRMVCFSSVLVSCKVINVSVQYNGGFLPGIIVLTLCD